MHEYPTKIDEYKIVERLGKPSSFGAVYHAKYGNADVSNWLLQFYCCFEIICPKLYAPHFIVANLLGKYDNNRQYLVKNPNNHFKIFENFDLELNQ